MIREEFSVSLNILKFICVIYDNWNENLFHCRCQEKRFTRKQVFDVLEINKHRKKRIIKFIILKEGRCITCECIII